MKTIVLFVPESSKGEMFPTTNDALETVELLMMTIRKSLDGGGEFAVTDSDTLLALIACGLLLAQRISAKGDQDDQVVFALAETLEGMELGVKYPDGNVLIEPGMN